MNIIKKIGIYVILTAIPIIIGVPFTIAFDNRVILEVVLVVFGLLEILYMNFRMSATNKRLYKKNISKHEFQATKEYEIYSIKQNILLFSGILNIFVSMLVFYLW